MDKNLEQRINNIIGQLEGVKKMMLLEDHDCFNTITQLKATKSAISSLMEKYMESEFDQCLLKATDKNREQLKKIFGEIIKK